MKLETKHFFTLFLAALVLGISMNLFAQVKELPPFKVQYSNSNGNTNDPKLTSLKPEEKPKDPKLVSLEAQLEVARTSGNTIAAQQIQSQIDNLLGHVIVHQPCNDPDVNYGNVNEQSENDYNILQIHPWSIYSHAFGIAPTGSNVAGRIFYVFSQDAASGSDSLKIMYSSNNGVSWGTLIWASMPNVTFNKDEMDIEIVYDGTTTWIFGVAGVTDNADGRKKIYFFRQKADGTTFYWTLLDFPGNGAGMNYYNPKITSDNSIYNSNAYIMMICSMDSTAGANHYVKQKYMLSTTPFAAAPGLNYAQPNGTGFYWSTALGTVSNAYLYGDIAYYRDDAGTGQSRVMTVYNCYGSSFNNIYIAYLNGYSTYGASLVVAESNVNKDLRIAFNGGAGNRNGMITYVRQFNSSSDWDIFGLKTTNGGSLAGDWTRDTIDYTGNRARTCDLIAVRGAVNQFKICYVEDNPTIPAGFYRSFNGSSWTSKIQMTNTAPDTIFAEPRAGYVLGGGDDGVGIWSLMNGYNGYLSKNMTSTTGIINSEIPGGFSLSQNYPNPFNPSTTIKFALPVSGQVSLKVYDITGRLVSELINQNLQAGTHEVSFNASDLSSGAYFYKLETKGFTDIKKMMLVK